MVNGIVHHGLFKVRLDCPSLMHRLTDDDITGIGLEVHALLF